METVAALYARFSERVADTCLQQKIAKDIFDNQIHDLELAAQRLEQDPVRGDDYNSRWAMVVRNAISGEYEKFGFSSLSFSARARLAYIHKNRQYQWLLAEVVEEFEAFLAGLCTVLFGGQSNSTVRQPSANRSLRTLRSRLPRLKETESKNALEVDFALRSMVTEQMRHHIVHTKGVVGDAGHFAEKVLAGLGEPLQGKGSEQRRQQVLDELPLATVDGRRLIALLEVHDENSKLPVYYSIFERYASALVTHANLIMVYANERKPEQIGT